MQKIHIDARVEMKKMNKKLRILIASDSFKGSLSSAEIAEIFMDVARQKCFESLVGVQIADGGEGTLEAILASGEFSLRQIKCKNPLFEDITSQYAIDGKGRAFIEMASASGLTLIPYAEGNAAITTSYGTGQMIADALKRGSQEIYISVGGSATNDCGIGALSALGFAFLDERGNKLSPIGKNLGLIRKIDSNEVCDFNGVSFVVMADVDNPLIGDRGATRFYGKQKGAIDEIADDLENGMISFANLVKSLTGVALQDMPHAGAAGGLAGGLIAFLGAKVKSGIDTVLELINFDEYIMQSDVVITGEGRLDEQSLHGKAISGVCKCAEKHGVPVYVMSGCLGLSKKEWRAVGIRNVVPLRNLRSQSRIP
jgi:glycerate kinase